MECDIQAFIDKAKLLGIEIKIKDIPGYKNHTCKLISLSDTEHVVWVPDEIEELDTDGSFARNIHYLKGTIKIIGGNNLRTAYKMFHDLHAQTLDLSLFYTGKIEDMRYMFLNCKADYIDLSSFDTSVVESMRHMFEYCKICSLDLSSFDTSNVIDMGYMFKQCSVTSLDLSSFDTSKVRDMQNMFEFCEARSINVSSFNINNVTNMKAMFRRCRAEKIDLSQWFNNGEEVYTETSIDNMFDGSTAMYNGTIIIEHRE